MRLTLRSIFRQQIATMSTNDGLALGRRVSHADREHCAGSGPSRRHTTHINKLDLAWATGQVQRILVVTAEVDPRDALQGVRRGVRLPFGIGPDL